jgi:hypothetical protein
MYICIILRKHWLGYIWGDFFHKLIWSPWFRQKGRSLTLSSGLNVSPRDKVRAIFSSSFFFLSSFFFFFYFLSYFFLLFLLFIIFFLLFLLFIIFFSFFSFFYFFHFFSFLILFLIFLLFSSFIFFLQGLVRPFTASESSLSDPILRACPTSLYVRIVLIN